MLYSSFPKYRHRGQVVGGEEALEAARISLVRQPLLAVTGIGRVATTLGEQVRERFGAVLGPEQVDVDTRRHLVEALGVSDDLLEDAADVRGADEDGARAVERLRASVTSSSLPRIEYSSSDAVRLDGIACAGSSGYGTAGQHVVREDEVGGELALERARVRVDVAGELDGRELLQQPRLEPLVAVEDEHRQKPVRQLRPHDLGPAEIEPRRVRVLAEDDDVVPGAPPRPRDLPRVDVRSGSFEQIPVPEQDAHAGSLRHARARQV